LLPAGSKNRSKRRFFCTNQNVVTPCTLVSQCLHEHILPVLLIIGEETECLLRLMNEVVIGLSSQPTQLVWTSQPSTMMDRKDLLS
jgi:hypothetical protein